MEPQPTSREFLEGLSHIVVKRQDWTNQQCNLLCLICPAQASTGKIHMLMALMRHKTSSSLNFTIAVFPVVLASGLAQIY